MSLHADLRSMNLAEQRDHLLWLVDELTAPPPDYSDMLAGVLTRAQLAIVGRLLRMEGRVVPHTALVAAMDAGDWGGSENPTKTLQVHVYNARRRLERAGVSIRIESVWGIGYKATVGRQ